MKLFRLLQGVHVQADHEWEPSEVDIQNAQINRTPLVPPHREFKAGQVVPSDKDLVDKFGPEKFQYVGEGGPEPKVARYLKDRTPGDPAPAYQRESATSYPGGQVSTGFQQSSQGPDGRMVAGPVNEFDPANESIDRATEQQKQPQPGSASTQPGHPHQQGQQPHGKTLLQPGHHTNPEHPASAPIKPACPPDSELKKMSVEDLRSLAADEEIDLKGATTKDDIIKRVKSGW